MNEPRWTIKEKRVNQKELLDANKQPTGRFGPEDSKKPSYTEHTLHFDGKKLFTAKTPIAAEELKLLCDKWNYENYVPVLSNTKLLHELPASVREKIQSYGPALPFGEEVKGE